MYWSPLAIILCGFSITSALKSNAHVSVVGSGLHSARLRSVNKTRASQHLVGKDPINTLYIRDWKLVGDKLGKFNSTIAEHGAIDLGVDTSTLKAGTHELITVGDVNVNLLEVTGALALLSGLACIWIPGCPAFVATNLGFASTADAAIELTTAVASATLKDLHDKRQNYEYEVWGCEPYPVVPFTCDNPTAGAVLNAISLNDGDQGESTSWSISEPDNGQFLGNWWHCQQGYSDCGLFDDDTEPSPTAYEEIYPDPAVTGHPVSASASQSARF